MNHEPIRQQQQQQKKDSKSSRVNLLPWRYNALLSYDPGQKKRVMGLGDMFQFEMASSLHEKKKKKKKKKRLIFFRSQRAT